MINERIKEHKEVLENRERTYETMSKTGRYISYFGLLLFLISFLSLPLSLGNLIPSSIAGQVWVSLFGLGSLIIFVGGIYNRLKGISSFYVSSEEFIFLELVEALTSLETYKKEKLDLARYQCLKELHKTDGLIKYYWVPPSRVQIVMREIGDEIVTFEERFVKNLIFSLESGGEIEKVDDILTEFGLYLIDPSKDKLTSLNKKMDSLPHSEVKHYPISEFFKHHEIAKYFLVIGLIFAISLSSSLFGFYYMHVSADTALIVFATIFGPLAAVVAAIIITYILRREH
jgi:hypothetical protein